MLSALQRKDKCDERCDCDIQFFAHHLIGAGGEVNGTSKLRVSQHWQVCLACQFAQRHGSFAAPLGKNHGGRGEFGIIGQRDRKVHRVYHQELSFLHRLANTATGQIALTLTPRHLDLGRPFGLLVFVLEVLKTHLQALVALEAGANEYRVLLGGLVIAQNIAKPGRLLAIDTGEVRAGHGLTGEPTRDPSFNCPALWIDPSARDHAVAEGFLAVDPSTVIATHANQELLKASDQLLGPEEVRELVDSLKDRSPALIEAVHPEPLNLAALTRVFRALIADGITLTHPQPLLTSLALALQSTQEFNAIIDAVRADLGARLVARICEPGERLKVLTLDAGLESTILGGMVDPASGLPIIEPDCGAMIAGDVADSIEQTGGPVALIVQPPARRALANLLRQRSPRCLVLSINELPANQPVEVIGVIGAAEPAQLTAGQEVQAA